MRRAASLCASVLSIAAALTATVGGATFAPFNAEAQGNGSPKAGRVDVVLNGDVDDEVSFAFDGEHCGNLAHGESCTTPIEVRNAGSLSVRYQVAMSDFEPDCFTSTLDIEAELEAGDVEGDDVHRDHDAGDVHVGTLTLTLDGDGPECQGADNTTFLTIHTLQSRSPHN